jgi:hypothetical protein
LLQVASDVLETVEFFVTASQFKLEMASEGLKKMLPLIWSKDNTVKVPTFMLPSSAPFSYLSYSFLLLLI